MIQFSGTIDWNRSRTLSKKSFLCNEDTHIFYPLLETFFVYSTRFKLEGENLLTTLFPAPKQSLAYSRPFNKYILNKRISVTFECLQLKFLE